VAKKKKERKEKGQRVTPTEVSRPGATPAPSSAAASRPSENEAIPFTWEWLQWEGKRLQKHVGRRWAFVIFGLIGLAFLALKYWSTITELPRVKPLLTQLSQEPVPKARPGFFSVVVAHLENDLERKNEKFIVDTLTALRGVEVLRLDRTISVSGPRPQESILAGHATAREFLRQSGGAVLVWGSVLDERLPRLYLTASRELGHRQSDRALQARGS